MPAYGDIVWGHFPHDEVPGPGPKSRPVLILAARIRRNKSPLWIEVQCAYGTSNQQRRTRFGLTVYNVSAQNLARLPQATLFDLDRIRWIPWSERWFGRRPDHPTPRIGKLPREYMIRLEAIRAQRQAQQVQQAQQSSNDDCGDDDDEYEGEEPNE